jgi:hypothetical protein
MSESRIMLSDLDDAARHAFLEAILETDAARAASAAGVDVGLTLRNMMRPPHERLSSTIALMKQHAQLTGTARLLRRFPST